MPQIEIELKGIDRALRRHSSRVVRSAASSALNKTTRAARTTASQEIRRTYTIKKKDLDRRTMNIIRAYRANLTAVISVTGRPISLAYFRARQLKKGVKVSILKGKRTMLTKRFIATMSSGHVGVYKRLTSKRLPIGEPKMVSIPSIFSGDRVMPAIQRTIRARWPRTFRHELNYYINRTR